MFRPTDMGWVLTMLTFRVFGALPLTYITIAMLADALDHVEWKAVFRADGFSMYVYTIIFTLCAGLAQGLFNFGLSATGYVPPFAADSLDALRGLLSGGGYTAQVALDTLQASGDGIFTVGIVQNPAVQNYFAWGYQGIYDIVMIVLMGRFWFYDVEKHLPQIQKDVVARHRAEAKAAKKKK